MYISSSDKCLINISRVKKGRKEGKKRGRETGREKGKRKGRGGVQEGREKKSVVSLFLCYSGVNIPGVYFESKMSSTGSQMLKFIHSNPSVSTLIIYA